MRNLKILGLALVAMFAMSAVGASMASADELTSELNQAVQMHGEKHPNFTDVFETTAGNTQCSSVTYHIGTVTVPPTTIRATPTYSGCTSSGIPAVIDTNGCHFLFHVTGGSSTVGDVTVECPSGKDITVTVSLAGTIKCTVHVPPQTLTGDPVTYTNIGSGTTREITVDVNAHGIQYTHTAGTGIGACTTGSGVTGAFKGKGILTANNHANTAHVGVFLSNA